MCGSEGFTFAASGENCFFVLFGVLIVSSGENVLFLVFYCTVIGETKWQLM